MAKKKTNEKPTVKEKLDVVQEATQPTTMVDAEVSGCERLNVRKSPRADASVIQIIGKGDKVSVDKDKTTANFYKVITKDGVEGFCMKKFIKLKK